MNGKIVWALKLGVNRCAWSTKVTCFFLFAEKIYQVYSDQRNVLFVKDNDDHFLLTFFQHLLCFCNHQQSLPCAILGEENHSPLSFIMKDLKLWQGQEEMSRILSSGEDFFNLFFGVLC